MKIKFKESKPEFKPFSISIEFETAQEFYKFKNLCMTNTITYSDIDNAVIPELAKKLIELDV